MKILYVIPRYHTNLAPAIKSLLNAGHEVEIITHNSVVSEDHSVISPTILGYNTISEYLCKLISKSSSKKYGKIKKYLGIPPVRRLHKNITEYNPDVLILRSGYFYPIVSMLIAKQLNSAVLFYDQRPKHGTESEIYNRKIGNIKITKVVDVVYKRIWNESPVRITPVEGDASKPVIDKNAYYIPFVKQESKGARTRNYGNDGEIRVLNIGRLHSNRKRHLMLLESFNELREQYNISLTIIARGDEFNEYANKISRYIYDEGLGDIVDIYWNLDYKAVQQAYTEHDIFVLPSSYEPAAVSHLEAMANGLPAICTEANGTSNYIKDGKNGYVIPTDDEEALTNSIEAVISDKEKLREMGRASLDLVNENHSPEIYEERLMEAVEDAQNNQS